MSKRIIPFLYLTLSSIFIIVSTSTAGTIDLPQTGQTKCYNSAGGEIACIGTGQDGEIRAGVEWPNPRFADNGEGTITDRLTGLIWLKDGNCFGPQTWYNSLDNIVDFNTHPRNYSCQDYTAAYTDWRLPNINELESLLNPEQQFPSTWLNDQGFINIQYSWYWSSTTRAATVGLGPALHCAWTMSMMVGWISTGSGTYGNSSAYLLPVRAGQSGSTNPNFPANVWKTGQKTSYYPGDDGDIQAGVSWPSERFTDNGDGTVTDNLTGLMWTKNGSTPVVDTCPAGIMTWQDALDFVACLNAKKYLGYEDWRLPNRKEFFSLIDCSQVNPALPTGHPFVNLTTEPNSNYWASTSAGAYSNAVAWLAMIKNEGGIGGTWKNNQAGYNYQVWPVRGGLSNPAPGHLDHFSFSTISSPQNVGTPFQVTISARDAGGGLTSSFNGEVSLTSNVGSVSPTSVWLVNGQATVSVTLYNRGTVRLNCNGHGAYGYSDFFDVTQAAVLVRVQYGAMLSTCEMIRYGRQRSHSTIWMAYR